MTNRTQPGRSGSNLLWVVKACTLALALLFSLPLPAFAGDGATIVLSSGRMIFINNGYTQIAAGLRELKKNGSENVIVEVNIEGSTFFINISDVAVVCRDSCTSMTIQEPKKER